jgi:hypothetical protein
MSRIANFIVLSFALLSDEEKVMSWKGRNEKKDLIPLLNSYPY